MTGSVPPPTITGFSPTSLSNGTGNVTITGTNFTGATSVTVGGTASTTTVNSPTSLTVAFPSKGRGTYAVVVTTPGGSASANFTYTVTPFISYITPSSVYYDYGSGYTIVGGRFSSSGAGSVYIWQTGGYYGISIANDGQLSFNPGALGAGSYTAAVTAPDGWSNQVGFSSIYYPAPSITSVSDGRGGNGSLTGSTITVGGSGFTGASVSIGGSAVTASVSDTSISFACPNLSTDGSKTITVTTARSGNQSASASVTFWAARSAQTTTYTSGSGSYTPPQWANFLDIVVIGGGGGGGAGGILAWGGGGSAGAYGATTRNLLSAGFGARSYSVGGGGLNGGAKGVNQPGDPGAASQADNTIIGSGGAAGCGFCNGAAGTSTTGFVLAGVTYPGVSGGGFGNSVDAATTPGSGGGGGNSGGGPFPGKPGRAGAVYFRAYQ